MDEEYFELHNKHKHTQKQTENLLLLNQKLQKSLKMANLKVTEIKMKYREKASAKCQFCDNEAALSALGGSF